tara:strand:+ start:336 stop:536 length:201 start_codon:yes stop_codon:yes gene_type:complete
MKIWVGIIDYRECYEEADCAGLWREREAAVKDISDRFNFNPEFSDAKAGYWGTEEWTLTLKERELA